MNTFLEKKNKNKWYTRKWTYDWSLYRLSDKDILFLWWWWWWLEIVGRDDDDELFEWCLLIIIKAVVPEEGGVLTTVGIMWSLEAVAVGVDGGAPTVSELFEAVRCCVCLEEATRSAWDWERPNWTLLGRNFDNIVDDGGTDGIFNVWRESVKSDV